ncbi:MAG: hypothetical protein ACJ8AD_14190 [Gemmatimonadaceae bacterium]
MTTTRPTGGVERVSGSTVDKALSPTRPAWLVPALVTLIATVVAWWASVPYVVGVFHDDGVYALLGKAIASGQGFRYIQLPGAPAATHYPPLYPLVLALLWRVAPTFPENIPILLGLNVLCLGAAALGLYLLLRRRLGWREEQAAAVSLVGILSTPVLTLASAVLSEPLFLAGLFPVLLMAERAVDRRDARLVVGTGVAVGLLMLERTHAVALLGAVVLMLLHRRAWRCAGLFMCAAAIVQLPWNLWTRTAELVAPPLRGAYGSYAGWFVEGLRAGGPALLIKTAQINLRELWLLLGDRILPGLPSPLGMLAVALFAGLLLVGAARAARRLPVTILFLALYLGIVLIIAGTPWRYVWAAWPFFVVLAVLGAGEALARVGAPKVRVAVGVVLLVPFAALLHTEARAFAVREWERPARRAARQAIPVVEWVRHNTAPTDIVLAECEEVVMLFAGRRSAPPGDFTAMEYLKPRTPEDDRHTLLAMLQAVPAHYVVSLMPRVQVAARTLGTERPALRELPGLPGAAVFRVER